jgi:hypothetical protein
VGHRHRWFCPSRPPSKGRNGAIIAFSTIPFKRSVNRPLSRTWVPSAVSRGRIFRRLDRRFEVQLQRFEPLIEETFCMSMQSHLAELEKRHQALQDEINECLNHPAVDDLKLVELKRK